MRCAYGLLSLALVGGCTSLPARPASQSDSEQIAVVVTNDGLSDVTVYAYRGGDRQRIGFVPAHSSSVVDVPRIMADPGHVQLLLHPVSGTPDFLVDEVPISGGDYAMLHVTPVLNQSTLIVRTGMAPR